jgi:glycosyltransferase involved in cell wall biosynthesis
MAAYADNSFSIGQYRCFRNMRVLHLAPLWFPVARDSFGGIETFLAGLITALEELGCENTLIASGDSRTPAELLPVVPLNLYTAMETGLAAEYAYYEQHQLLLALERVPQFDVVHSHIGWGGYVLSGVPDLHRRVLHTQHIPVAEDQGWFVNQRPSIWFSAVSDFQARKLRQHGTTHCQVIHSGIDVEAFTFQPQGGEGLLFLGRMEREKGPDLAIHVARRLNRPLILAGPMIDEGFFEDAIEPLLNDQIQYVGVVDHREKDELLGQAACLLMPSRCEESFGMVSLEALACGTPVVALANGGLPEIIEPDLTGYLTQDEHALAALVSQAMKLDRATIRARVAARFDFRIVADKYRELYTQIVKIAHEDTIGRQRSPRGALG